MAPVGVFKQRHEAPKHRISLTDGELWQSELPSSSTKDLCHALSHAPVFVRPDGVDGRCEAGGAQELQEGDQEGDGFCADGGGAFAHAGHHWGKDVGGEAAKAVALLEDDNVQNVQRVSLHLKSAGVSMACT